MVNLSLILFVENLCISLWKTLCISLEKLCAKLLPVYYYVYKTFIPQSFSAFSTHFSTLNPPLYNYYFFHYSTSPTITTINKYNKKGLK